MNNLYIYILFFLILFSSCSGNLERIPPVHIQENQPDMSITDLKTKYNTSLQLKAKVIAPLVNNFEKKDNPYSEFPQGVEVYFYDEDFVLTSSLIADYAIYYKKQELWKASGNVVITNSKGATVRTQELYGNESTNEIYSMKFTELTEADGNIINAKNGFDSNIDFHPFALKNVDGTIVSKADSTKN